ncbi:NTF2 fold immunity protein [Neorhodopirellula lusitana]|uniref:NTF2 fold immunity protein n=1 Tax=Neorhodopirellula lusitana TaxID=445327 RepID=A0ABY1QU24_9BACT|nr:NTF2 fold immunity protein [Neorhodopirellula lusitana]SMP80166.1 NTF2 fold immunity protein [Neorhodopirellula lusitana]
MDCDHDDPESVVLCFIAAMHQWELDSHAARRAARDTADPYSYQPAIVSAMAHVFSQFCTPKPRPHGRNASFQNPPEYNPDHESIQSSATQGRAASVYTHRDSVFGGLFRYTLKRIDNRWLIDTLWQRNDDDSESPAVL